VVLIGIVSNAEIEVISAAMEKTRKMLSAHKVEPSTAEVKVRGLKVS